MKNYLLLACLAVMCSGCSVTMTGEAVWSEAPDTAGSGELQERYDKLLSETKGFVSEISAASTNLESISAVLAKYGINAQ